MPTNRDVFGSKAHCKIPITDRKLPAKDTLRSGARSCWCEEKNLLDEKNWSLGRASSFISARDRKLFRTLSHNGRR